MIDATFVEKILQLAHVDQFEIDGRQYTTKALYHVVPPTPAALTVSSLRSFCDYVKSEIDAVSPSEYFVVVEGPENVCLVSALDEEHMKRIKLIEARIDIGSDEDRPNFKHWIPLEEFIMALQSGFVDTEDKTKLLKVVGNLADQTVFNYSDDGVSQQVVAKSGVSRVEKADLPNPVRLAPYRTFADVDQPISKFIFRMKQMEKGVQPSCKLKPADGGAWKLEAVANVANYLRKILSDFKVLS